jgi:hypothetical protein
MPNAPGLVPDLAAGGRRPPASTTEALQSAAARVLCTAPAAIVLLSPDSRGAAKSFGLVVGDTLGATFHECGAPTIGAFVPGPGPRGERLIGEAQRLGVSVLAQLDPWLDDRALVPLYFLRRAGWDGPTLVIAPPRASDPARRRRFGGAVRAASSGERWAVVASAGAEAEPVHLVHAMVERSSQGSEVEDDKPDRANTVVRVLHEARRSADRYAP